MRATSSSSSPGSPTATAISRRAASTARSGGIGYRTIRRDVIPASRSATASSKAATHSASAPASARARAIGIIPWP